MSYESPLKYFRDEYKNPDEYKKKHPNWRDSDLEGNIGDFEEETNKDHQDKIERLGAYGGKYKAVIDLIKSAGLKPEFETDLAEQQIIENRRNLILKYLETILDDVRNYLSQVNYLELQKAGSYDDISKFQEAIGVSDNLRRSYHNKMISDIKIAVRLINVNFNADFPEEMRLNEELKIADRKTTSRNDLQKKMAERQYYNFPYPAGIFID